MERERQSYLRGDQLEGGEEMKSLLTICIRTYSGEYNGKIYNRLDFLKRNMKSLYANTQVPYELVIIDDRSTLSDQIHYLRTLEKAGKVSKLIVKEKNLGRQHSFALQRKLGYEMGTSFVYICDDDYTYQNGWAREMIEAYKILQRNLKSRPVGILSGFSRMGMTYRSEHEFEGKKFGMTNTWTGCRMFMSRDVLKKGVWDEMKSTKDWPKKWTSPWIDDGSYQRRLTDKFGFEEAFILLNKPSLIDHIGTFGVHAPNIMARGVK